MDSAELEVAFFAVKLGMLFNAHDSRMTIVGLDSQLYGQSSAPSHLLLPPTQSEADSSPPEDNYEKAIIIDASNVNAPLQENSDNSVPAAGSISVGNQHPSQPNQDLDNRALTTAESEFLSAFANFDDGVLSPVVDHHEAEHADSINVLPTFEVVLARNESNFPGGVIGQHPHVDHHEGMVDSDSYEDFQNALNSMSSSKKHKLHCAPTDEPSYSSELGDHANLSLHVPGDTNEKLLGEESPFDFGYSPQPGNRSVQNSTTKCRAKSGEEKPDWLAPLTPPPPLPLTPPPPTPTAPPPPCTPPPPLPSAPAPTHDPSSIHQSSDSEDEESEDGFVFEHHSPHSSQFSAFRERTRILQLFGFVANNINKTQISALAKAVYTGSCEQRKWLLETSSAECFIGASIEFVNGVQIRDLDPAFQLALMKQRARPLFIRFRPMLDLLNPGKADANSLGNHKIAAPVASQFSYKLFMAKYTSTAAAKIRSTVDSTLQDYIKCDWADVKRKKEGLPQVTVVSIYKFIEFEMNKLELFSHYHARGYGVPVEMLESHWDDVRGHIESLVYRAIGPFTRTLWPIFSNDSNFDRYEADEFVDAETAASDLKTNTFIGVDLNITSTIDADESHHARIRNGEPEVTSTHANHRAAPPMVELSAEHPLRMKLAFLRFVTLESTGLDCGEHKPKQGDEEGTFRRTLSIEGPRRGSAPELETPQGVPVCAGTLQEQVSGPATKQMIEKIRRINRVMLRHKEEWYLAMRGLCRAMQLETPGDVLHALVNTVKLISHSLDAYINRETDESVSAVESVLRDVCGTCNAYRRPHIACSCGEIHVSTEQKKDVTMSLASALHFPHTQSDEISGEEIADIFNGKRCLTVSPHSLSSAPNGAHEGKTKKKKEHRPLSADDLMPAITWVLIQANPPNIEYVLWMCSEFRHPSLLRGEEAFCLAQLSSAVEFCKHATYKSFDIPHCDYNALMLSYNNTLKLLLACKTGDLEQVQDLVEHGNANINGLSPDHKDSPLTACIKFGRHAILRYLLSRPEVDPDSPVQLFHGPDQRSTPLMVAAQYNQLEMVIDLLVAGADRHYCNDSGNSAISIAEEEELTLVALVLKADPVKLELVGQIILGEKQMIIGLLLQKVSVNYLLEPENQLSPLIAAVLRKDADTLRFMLNKRLCSIEVDMMNCMGETAFIACAKEFAQNPSQDMLNIAAMLLRFGANRYLRDNSGKSACDYIYAAREEMKEIHRQAHNPFAIDAELPPPPVAAAPPPPPVPVKTTAATITAPTKKRLSAAVPAIAAASPFTDSPGAPRTHPPVEAPVAIEETPSPVVSVKINPVHKQLLKEFSALLSNDPYKKETVPIFELARDKLIDDVRAMLYQGVHANAICVTKGYSALIAAVYNSDLPMLKLIIQSDEICKQTYFSTQFSIISAILSIVNGTVDTLEADAELLVNADGITEGEVGGYLRSIGPNDPVHVSDDGEIKLVSKRNIVDLDQSGRNGMRALHYASQIGDIRIVGALLQAGAAREVFNDKLHTPLDVCLANDHIDAANAIRFDPERVSICLAAKHGDWTVMSALLCQGVSINTQRNHMSKTGDQLHHELFTPLLAAVAHGQAEVVKRILDVPGVNVNLANSLNQTALMFAAARGDEPIVLLLLSRGADRWVLDKQGYIATAWAESRNRDAIAIILKHDPARIWIHDVIRNNDFAATIGMLKQNVDPNLRRMTQLVPHSPATIAGHGKLQMDSVSSSKTKTSKAAPAPAPVKAAAGIDQHHEHSGNGSGFIHGETPLIVAARYGRLDTIDILLKAPPPHAVDQTITDSAGNSALHHATLKGHEEAVLLLLKAHASRHLRNTMGLNPSAVAKSAGFVNIAAIIDADPYTVHIHDMCEQGNMRMVVALLKQGCPVNYQDPRASKRQQTPLMAASIGGQPDIVRMLLRNAEAQEHIDDQDSIGRTALMRAASVGALSVTAILLNAGCDRTLKDKDGLTARDHASKHSYTVMFQFISQSMVR